MAYKLIPKNLVAESILHNHQTEATSPIGCVHVYHDILMLGYNTDMAHTLETAPYCALVNTITCGKLGERLLAFYVFPL